MLGFIKNQLFGASVKNAGKLQADNAKLLKQSISELEKFNSEQLPMVMKSNNQALKGLEQTSNNLKALMKIK